MSSGVPSQAPCPACAAAPWPILGSSGSSAPSHGCLFVVANHRQGGACRVPDVVCSQPCDAVLRTLDRTGLLPDGPGALLQVYGGSSRYLEYGGASMQVREKSKACELTCCCTPCQHCCDLSLSKSAACQVLSSQLLGFQSFRASRLRCL